MQDPNVLLTILSSMAQKPDIKFDKLFQKLYNPDLWLMAYESIAANPGNMTPGTDGKTADGFGMATIERLIEELKASRYKPHPAQRTYIPKANGKLRPIGIPCFEDKVLQTVVKFILQAIYEPTFSNSSHGFRPNRSCHTALLQVKVQVGTRWWVEGDIKGFFDNMEHATLLRILGKRITDKRFLYLIEQFLQAGYMENWEYQKTYSGTPQGSNLSPILANIYLHELDVKMAAKIAEFNRGKQRKIRLEYKRVQREKRNAKKRAQETGDWSAYKALQKQLLRTQPAEAFDPEFRRLTYVRYADDFLIGVIGSKADANAIKQELAEFLKQALQLELSEEKTLITHVTERVRFLGYDIKQWRADRVMKHHSQAYGMRKSRSVSRHLALLMPRDKVENFAQKYGSTNEWHGQHRSNLVYLSELEIMHIYNTEVRGFLNYYRIADNFTDVGSRVLWLCSNSFFRTLARKRQTTRQKVAKSLKRGAAKYVIPLVKEGVVVKEYELTASTRQFKRTKIQDAYVDKIPSTWQFRARTELGKRLLANECGWCGTTEGYMEVHHVRKMADLKTKAVWEVHMLARRRKTMVLCRNCHDSLHAGKLTEQNRKPIS